MDKVELYREKVVGKEDKVFYKYYVILALASGKEIKQYIQVSYEDSAILNQLFD